MSLALLACTGAVIPAPATGAGAAGSPEDAARFIAQNIGLTSSPLTLEQLRRRVRPQNEGGREVRNRHVAGQVDRIVVMTGEGIEVEAYVPASGPVLVQRITVSAEGRKVGEGLRTGRSTLDDVYGALGETAENAKGPGGEFAKRYFNLERTASALLWFGRNERLSGVEWRFGGD